MAQLFGILEETAFITSVAELGVIVLMFCAGMETDINELKASGKASLSLLCAEYLFLSQAVLPCPIFFNRPGVIESDAAASLMLQNVFIGIILTATSVSISVETLKELGKLKTRSGNAILGAAIIDDILGIIGLTIVTSMADSSVSIAVVLLKILGFFVFAAVVGVVVYRWYHSWVDHAEKGIEKTCDPCFCILPCHVLLCRRIFSVWRILPEPFLQV